MKRNICILLAALLALGTLSGCGKIEYEKEATVEGAIFGGQAGDRIRVRLAFDPSWLIKMNNKKYHRELAELSTLLSADVYFREKDLAKGTQNRVLTDGTAEAYDAESLLRSLGFTEVRRVESFKEKEYAFDQNDSVTMMLGYRAEGKRDLFVVAVRGSFSIGEWLSAFDLGCTGADAGEHPEWTDRSRVKSLDVAAGRARAFFDEFVQANARPGAKASVLVTGHSRGAAIANILGAELEKEGGMRCYTYTFNTPGVTADAEAPAFRTVFNLFDSADFYTDFLPFANEKFYRYGTDLALDLQNHTRAQSLIAAYTDRADYQSPSAEFRAEYARLFAERFPDRSTLLNEREYYLNFSSSSDAEDACTSLTELAQSMGGASCCRIDEPLPIPGGGYFVRVAYSAQALLNGFATLLAYGQPALDAFLTLYGQDEAGTAIARLLAAHADELAGGHLLVNDYVICRFAE